MLLCLVCLFDLASFFFASHLSLKHVHVHMLGQAKHNKIDMKCILLRGSGGMPPQEKYFYIHVYMCNFPEIESGGFWQLATIICHIHTYYTYIPCFKAITCRQNDFPQSWPSLCHIIRNSSINCTLFFSPHIYMYALAL